jgi:colanic acid/amylovoran biosynthesis glycosyltransferase
MRVAVVAKRRAVVSETFIDAHIKHLPFEVVEYYQADWRGDPTGPGRLWPYWARLARRILGLRLEFRTFHDMVLAREFSRTRIDIVLAEFGTIGAQVYRATALAGIPLVVHFRGSDATDRSIVGPLEHEYPRMLKTARKVVCVSESLAVVVKRWLPEDAEVAVIPSGIDPKTFSGASPGSVGPNFIAVGRLVEKKAPHLTIQAFAQVAAQVPEATLVIIGDGPLRSLVVDEIARLGLGERIQLVGAVGQEVVAQLMRQSRCFVQHSVTAASGDAEGMPKAVSEAQTMGLPVVATVHAGIPEVVLQGETGILIEEHDVTGMAAAMMRLALDPGLADLMGNRAREHAVQLVSLDKTIDNISNILQEAWRSAQADEYPKASNSRAYRSSIRFFVRALRYS